MVGGDDYNTSPFNLATQGQRQPGSAFKPFVLAEALKRGHLARLGVVVAQEGLRRPRLEREVHRRELQQRLRGRRPRWPTRRRPPTTRSSPRSASRSAPSGSRKLARRMGIRTPVSHNWAITLGGLKQGVTPLDMAHAYETFAREGKLVYGTLSPGALRKRQPVPGPVGIRAIGRARTASSSRSSCPTASRRATRSRPSGCSTRASPTRSTTMLQGVRQERHRQARAARSPHPGGRQDRHDGELRRRLVRRLDARLHRRGVGRLPEEVRSR